MVTAKRISSLKQILQTKDYIVLDTETTGLIPDTDKIIEIGMVRVVNDEMVNQNGTFINPERPISASASKVNGIKAADVKQAPTYSQIAPSIGRLLIGNTVVAHNADFDLRFICRMLSDAGLDGEIRYIDTMRLSRELFPEMENHKLGTLCASFGIDPGNAHRAVDDSVACFHVLQRCKERAAVVKSAPKAPTWKPAAQAVQNPAPAVKKSNPASKRTVSTDKKAAPLSKKANSNLTVAKSEKTKKKRRKWWLWIVALLIVGSCSTLTKKPEDAAPAPTESPVVVEALPSPEALEPTPIPETPEPSHGPDYLVLTLSADDPGEYGVWKTLNVGTDAEYSFVEFHIPAGKYSVRNSNGSTAAQVSIYQDGYTVTDAGWEEPIVPDGVRPVVIMPGETAEIFVDNGQYVKLADGDTGLWFDLLEKAPAADTLSAAAPLLSSTLSLKTDDFPDTTETRSIPETQAEEAPVPALDPEPEPPAPSVTYVINTNTGKFHKPSCSSVEDIKPENRWDYTGTRDSVISMGYVACKRCHP